MKGSIVSKHSSFDRNVPRYYLFSGLTSSMFWLPIWIIFLQDRGLSLGQIGMLEVVALIVGAVMEVPTGVVADTYGRKVSLTIGAFLNGLALLALLTGVLSPVFLIGYILWNVSYTFFSGAGEALLYDSLKLAGRDADYTAITGRNMVIVQAAGGIAGLLGGLIAAWDMRACFVITAVLTFAAAAVALSMKEPPHADDGGNRLGYRENLRVGMRIAVSLPRVRYIILFGATISLFSILLVGFLLQPYAEEVGLPIWSMGAILLLANGGAMVGAWLAGRAERRLGRTRLLVIVPAAVVGLQLLLWVAAAPPAVMLFAAISLAIALAQPILSAMLNEAIPSAQRATVISLQSLLFSLVASPLQIALLTIAARTSAAFAIGVAAVLLACLVVPVFLLLQRASSEREPDADSLNPVVPVVAVARALAAD